MKTELKIYTVEQICDGFEYNELEGKGLYGLAGQLTIQPEFSVTTFMPMENVMWL